MNHREKFLRQTLSLNSDTENVVSHVHKCLVIRERRVLLEAAAGKEELVYVYYS